MPDLRIAATPLFTSVSVTAERWVDLEEVPVAQLPLWLSHARARVGAVSWHQHTSVVWRGERRCLPDLVTQARAQRAGSTAAPVAQPRPCLRCAPSWPEHAHVGLARLVQVST